MSESKHTFEVYEVEVKDGTYAPSPEAKSDARATNEVEPHEKGYRHAQGMARTVTRYAWRSSTGRSSNGCTFPTHKSAEEAARQHVETTRAKVA